MGGSHSHPFSRTKDIPVLILGLDMGGKTTFVWKLKVPQTSTSLRDLIEILTLWNHQVEEVVRTIPTIGFNVETVPYRNRSFCMWDCGGTEKFRPQWRGLFEQAEALIFVVDSADFERFGDAGNALRCFFSQMDPNDTLRRVPLLVFANKQDQPAAKPPVEVLVGMQIDELLQGRRWRVVGSCFTTGMGMEEGMAWLWRALGLQ